MYQTSYMSLWYLMMKNKIDIIPLDVERKNLVPNKPKAMIIPFDKQKNLLLDWQESEGCLASEKIIIEGKQLNLMYREEPVANWDSGWRFSDKNLSKNKYKQQFFIDEFEQVKNIYHLNTLCNYEPRIMSLLHAPIGSAFVRVSNGDFVYFNLDDLEIDLDFGQKNVTLLN